VTARFRWGRALPRLAAARVVLRPLRPADAADLLAIFGDPRVMRYWTTPAFHDLADARALVREVDALFHARELFEWGIALAGDDRVIGTATLWHLEPAHRRGEIGFALGRAHWGRGFAGEAVATLVAFAFERLRLHRLEADVDPRNEPSLRLLEKLGFRREGTLRERYFVGDEIQDTVMLGLLAPEWAAGRAGAAGAAAASSGP
jgi:RimJ/RimL family protein N-acetyltransferase